MEREKEQMHDEQIEVNTEPKHDKQIVREKEQKHEHKEFNTETKHDKQKENDEEQKHYEQAEDDTELKETECETKSFIVMLEEELEEKNLKLRFGNKDDVVLDVLDFAGQGEYYASHQTYIRKDAIFILLVDTSKDVNKRLEQQEKKGNLSIQKAVDKNISLCDRPGVAFHCWSPKDYFYYWLKTIQIHGGISERIIFVGTHEDQKRKDFDFGHLLHDAMTENLITEKYSKPIIINLGKYDKVTEEALSKIKNDICILIKKCKRENQPAKWVRFASRFDIIKKKFHMGKIEDVLQMIDHFDLDMSDTEVADMLHFFHSSGKIVFFNIDRLQDIVILDIPWFINCFKHIIADRKHMEEDCSIVDVKEQKMLRNFHEKGVLENGLYRKLLTQKGISEQYQNTLGEYQSKLGMMFYIQNYKMNDGSNIDGWYVPSINTQEFKPSIERYGSDVSSEILCIKFKDYLPHDFFGRLIVACVNSGHWNPYDFRLCKAGADMCYRDSDNDSTQIYLFTSRRIVTVQLIGKHSKKHGPEVKQEILNVVRQLVQFYARSNEYEIGFLCRKKEGYTEDSVNHFVSKRYKYCQGCHGTCDWVDTESFWKGESNRGNSISAGKLDPLLTAFKVFTHVVTRVTEIAAYTTILEGIRSTLEWAWIDYLAFIGKELNDLHRKSDADAEKKETALRDINKILKKVVCGLNKNMDCKDLRKEIFFLWTQTKGLLEEIQGIPVVSLIQKEKLGNEIALEAKSDVQIRHHLWLRKIHSNRKYKVLRPSDEEVEKYEFQEYEDKLFLTIKNFDEQDNGDYFVLVVTETGASVCGETVQLFVERHKSMHDIEANNVKKIYDTVPKNEEMHFLQRSQIKLDEEILGRDDFWFLVKGECTLRNGYVFPVTVKTLKNEDGGAKEDMLKEARFTINLNHKHIIRMIGICDDDCFMLVLELAPKGSLKHFLSNNKDVKQSNIIEIMWQVAQGMEYLQSLKYVHRDLRSSNVLLVDEHMAKISGFGMSEALSREQNYYEAQEAGRWPLKWFAPECVYYWKFSCKSDVWSYGVTLWEATSYGDKPYKNMKGEEILHFLFEENKRLLKPARCPEEVYKMMLDCWKYDENERPTFTQLETMMSLIYTYLKERGE